MKWFNKKPDVPKELPTFLIGILVKINGTLKKCAQVLQNKTIGFSRTKLKVLLVLFCIPFLIISTVIIIKSLQEKNHQRFSLTPIRVMPLIVQSKQEPQINEMELQRIHLFKVYLDSLGTSTRGRIVLDSLLKNRPQLMDTLEYLNNLYLEQHKK